MRLGTKLALPAIAGICILANFLSGPAVAKVERSSPPSGQIISVNGDEQIRFVAEPDWRAADAQQDLLTGLAADTPVAVIQSATLPTQRHATTTLERLHATLVAEQLGSPSVIVVGDVVRGIAAVHPTCERRAA